MSSITAPDHQNHDAFDAFDGINDNDINNQYSYTINTINDNNNDTLMFYNSQMYHNPISATTVTPLSVLPQSSASTTFLCNNNNNNNVVGYGDFNHINNSHIDDNTSCAANTFNCYGNRNINYNNSNNDNQQFFHYNNSYINNNNLFLNNTSTTSNTNGCLPNSCFFPSPFSSTTSTSTSTSVGATATSARMTMATSFNGSCNSKNSNNKKRNKNQHHQQNDTMIHSSKQKKLRNMTKNQQQFSSTAATSLIKQTTVTSSSSNGTSTTTATTTSTPAGRLTRKQNVKDAILVDDALLAKELNNLTVQERNQIMEEVHGVSSVVPSYHREKSDQEWVQALIRQVQEEISKITKPKRRAYDRAIFLKPSLLHDTSFHLLFLRADSYEPKKAAQRMVTYFANKLELFGPTKLVSKITLDDLCQDEDDYEALSTGAVQIMKQKDQAGRLIWFIALRHYKYKHWKNQIRYIWYQVMAGLEDEEAQINGVVDVLYVVDSDTATGTGTKTAAAAADDAASKKKKSNGAGDGDDGDGYGDDEEENHKYSLQDTFKELLAEGSDMINDLPFRMVAFHFCYSEQRLRPVMRLIQWMIGQPIRLRFRAHYGSHLEVQYALMTFGIPMQCSPIMADGTLKPDLYDRYLKERKEKEEQWQIEQAEEERKTGHVLYPLPNDVILGRGRPYQEYVGNQKLARIVERYRMAYQRAADRFEKTCISMDVVKSVYASGGRFLQKRPMSIPKNTQSDITDNNNDTTNINSNSNSNNNKNNNKKNTNDDHEKEIIGEYWEIVPDNVAREKVSHSFRTKTSLTSSSAY